MTHQFIEKSCMGFKLPDGKIFLIQKEDIAAIVEQLWVEVIMRKPVAVHLLNDVGLKRAIELYKVYKSERDNMAEEMRQKCLKTIIDFLTDNNYELDTLENQIKNNTTQK
jgi:hypothetical protein